MLMQSQKNVARWNNYGNNTIPQLVTVSVESSLLGHDVVAYEKVTELLEEKYHCTMFDCYNHPEYLSDALRILPGNLCSHVRASIQKGLGEFSYIDDVSRFLDELNK